MKTPEEIKPHAHEYQDDAWKAYSAEELFWWVKLLNKRASQRVPGPKRDKDLYDAQNYLKMLNAHLSQ